jgi:predicted metal-dependent hydrolase
MAKQAASRNLPLFTEDEVKERLHILLAGVQQFNDGYFFEAHETWEDLWMQSPWPVRRFLQGLIQLAAAFVHLVRHEYPGTVRLLGHGLEKLQDFTPAYLDVDVERLLIDAAAAREALLELGPDRLEEWPRERIPKIVLRTAGPSAPAKV